ncbi:MAG: hypothetical protein MMC33_003280 [Icmadophila ericetorum]|nr:hypothetical protein [Icmadophila ericetorum]
MAKGLAVGYYLQGNIEDTRERYLELLADPDTARLYRGAANLLIAYYDDYALERVNAALNIIEETGECVDRMLENIVVIESQDGDRGDTNGEVLEEQLDKKPERKQMDTKQEDGKGADLEHKEEMQS